ncbi:MAG: S8 family serine peptidase [Saprospiraceae bacterium]
MKSLWTILFIIFTFPLFSQKENSAVRYIPNEFIIQLETGTNPSAFFQKIKKQWGESGITFQKEHRLSEKLNLFSLKSSTDIQDVNTLLENLTNRSEVKVAGQNFQLQSREKIPNDPLFTSQWDMEIINAPEVWETTTGGVTALGDTIVVAMMESGDWRHDDLQDNVWINWNEINNDGIDNDGNGFVDDYFGWNVVDSTDLIGFDFQGHGIRVGGIIGARGDNDMGIAGVNWNVKIMWVQNNLFIDKIIEGYEYVYQNRKLYNETNGAKGAFIVASNGSFGIDGDSPDYPDGLQLSDNPLFPLWCEVHEMLGEVGVLNVGSTNNKTLNVDEVGDMPSICPTEHLIVVAESDKQDELSSGYGKTHVDLTAPGDGSPSTGPDNTYATIGSTSGAAPHVAGGIALLYSLPCEKLALAARENPKETSLAMRDIILGGVERKDDQVGKTTSEGRLDLEKSMKLVNDFCGSGIDLLTINSISPNPTSDFIEVEFTPNQYGDYEILIFNSIGQLMAETSFTAKEFLPAKFKVEGVGALKTGIYFLRISNELDYTTEKFLVAKD